MSPLPSSEAQGLCPPNRDVEIRMAVLRVCLQFPALWMPHGPVSIDRACRNVYNWICESPDLAPRLPQLGQENQGGLDTDVVNVV